MWPCVARRIKITSVFMLLLSTGANASGDNQQRKTFLSAEKLTWQANTAKYQHLYQQLYFYPLQPYLDQQRLIQQMQLTSVKEIAEFLQKFEGTPLDWPLRSKWLNYLIKKKQQQLFITFFKPTTDAALTCTYLKFMLNSGAEPKTVLPQVTQLWTVGKSQPKSCDALFKQWQEAGYQTETVIWNRLALAANGGDHTLLPYLTDLLTEPNQYLGHLWYKVRRDPGYIAHLNEFKQKSEQETSIFEYGIKRLIWRSPEKALTVYKKAAAILPFSDVQRQRITQKFGLALASLRHQDAQLWLHSIDDNLINNNVVQWRIADALRKQSWPALATELLSLPKADQSTLQWQYWYARSLLATNQKEQGTKILENLAIKRHYYGFLAASYLNIAFSLQDIPLQITNEEKTDLLENPAAKRAFELFHLGRYNAARLEWNYWQSQLDDRQKLVAAKIANEAKWYDRAIFTLSQVGYLDDVDLRFPLAFATEINDFASHYDIDPAWVFAISRRESSFMTDAQSAVGAKGLMQLMPKTAKQLHRRSVSGHYLLNAKNNINLGTKYLRNLLELHNGNQVLATAAYNAGPNRVKSWLKDADNLPLDMWIETIPYKETRDYVKSVMAYQQIYQSKIGPITGVFNQLIQSNVQP